MAPIWHEFSPTPYQSPAPKPPVYTDTQDNTQSDIYSETPDFSEFKDPWENYCIQNDPVINKKEDNNETEQYYSRIDRSSPITVLRNEYNSVKSAQQAHYETPLEHNRESFHKQQRNEYNSPAAHIQCRNQEQSNQFVSENKQQNSFFHSENTPNTISGHSNYWGNRHITESHVHSAQNHRYSESQQQHQHVNHQHYCNDSNASLSDGTNQHQHVEHRPAYQHSGNESHKSLPEQVREHQHVEYQYIHQDSSNNNNDKPWSEQAKQHQHNEPRADYQHDNQHHVPDYQHNQHHVHDYQHNQHHVHDYQHNQHRVHDCQHNQHHVHDYQHNQHHVHDDVNKQQPPQHREQEDHIVHSNEQTNFVHRNHESLNDNVRHEQAAETAAARQNDYYSIKESGERGENINITDERTQTHISTGPHPLSKPCTDIHNVATQSDPHVTEDSSNVSNCSHILFFKLHQS